MSVLCSQIHVTNFTVTWTIPGLLDFFHFFGQFNWT